MDLGRDAYRSERTERDIRLVGADYYFIVRSRLIETRGPCVPYPVHLYHNTVQHQRFSAARYRFR
jgi:hypothetical protein